MKTIRIGTRGSDLAVWQARFVASVLVQRHSGLNVEMRLIKTEGDRRTDVPLTEIGGKNLFVKELEYALLDGQIDIAVHSMKDVTVNLGPDFEIPIFLKRENPCDAFVSNTFASIEELPHNARVGTCSLRRQSQLLAARKDLTVAPLRGNVPTRLARLDEGRFDGIILAVAGLKRLGLDQRIAQIMPAERYVPSPGQGALGIECRTDDLSVREIIAPLNHDQTWISVNAERQVNRRLGGSCHVPLGVYAQMLDQRIKITASVGLVDGSRQIRETASGCTNEAMEVADVLADTLIASGAEEIIQSCETSASG